MDGGNDGAVNMIPRPRFDGTFNWGHVYNGVMLTLVVVGGLIYIVRWQGAVDAQLISLSEGVTAIKELSKWQAVVDSKLQTSETNRAVYLPKINAVEASDRLQDIKIEAVTGALGDIKAAIGKTSDAIAETNKKVGDIATTIAVIEERTKKEGTPN